MSKINVRWPTESHMYYEAFKLSTRWRLQLLISVLSVLYFVYDKKGEYVKGLDKLWCLLLTKGNINGLSSVVNKVVKLIYLFGVAKMLRCNERP